MNFFPLCTASVWPTISGTTVERRDQVLMTFFSPPRFMTSIFSRSGTSTKGPFFSDLLICFPSGLPATVHRQLSYLLRRCTMKRSVRFAFLVLYPLVGLPQGETG